MNPGTQTPARARAWQADLALLTATLIWGMSFVAVKQALRSASPLALNAARMGLAALLLALIYRHWLRRLTPAIWRAGLALGGWMTAGFVLQTEGLRHTTPARSAFLTGFSVILVPFLGALQLRKSPRPRVWLSALLALAGLYFLAFARAGWSGWPRLGDGLTLLGAVAFAGMIQALENYCTRLPFQPLAVLQVAVTAILFAILAPWAEPMVWKSSPQLWALIAFLAVLATALAFTLQTWAQQYTPANHVAVLLALEPVFAWLGGWYWLHSELAGQQLLGAGLILIAILASGWPTSAPDHPSPHIPA